MNSALLNQCKNLVLEFQALHNPEKILQLENVCIVTKTYYIRDTFLLKKKKHDEFSWDLLRGMMQLWYSKKARRAASDYRRCSVSQLISL